MLNFRPLHCKCFPKWGTQNLQFSGKVMERTSHRYKNFHLFRATSAVNSNTTKSIKRYVRGLHTDCKDEVLDGTFEEAFFLLISIVSLKTN